MAQLDVDPERTDDVLQGSVACAGIRYVFGAYDLHVRGLHPSICCAVSRGL